MTGHDQPRAWHYQAQTRGTRRGRPNSPERRHLGHHPSHDRHHHHHDRTTSRNNHGYGTRAHRSGDPDQNALLAATGDYVARHLVPQLQRGSPSRPVSLFMNYGTIVLPDDTPARSGTNAVVFNAPGSTMILTRRASAAPGGHDAATYNAHVAATEPTRRPHPFPGAGGGSYVVAGPGRGRLRRAGDAVLRTCPGCGLLRVTSGGYCRDCDIVRFAADGAATSSQHYLAGTQGRLLGF